MSWRVCETHAQKISHNIFSLFSAIIGQYPLCPLGCTSCSEMNGCVSCSPNFYMLLVRNGMRQTGVCTHNCPTGFYGVRRSNYSQCYSKNSIRLSGHLHVQLRLEISDKNNRKILHIRLWLLSASKQQRCWSECDGFWSVLSVFKNA